MSSPTYASDTNEHRIVTITPAMRRNLTPEEGGFECGAGINESLIDDATVLPRPSTATDVS